MPYGQGRRLGETIDPRLMQADFSGVERAGQYIGRGIADIGQGIGVREGQKKDITAADETAESIKRLLPDYADLAQAAQEKLRNKDISHRDKRGIAESLDNMLKIGMAQRKFDMDALGYALERDRLEASMRGEPITVLTPDEVRAAREQGISLSDGFIDDQGNFHVRKVGVPLPKPAGWTYGTDAAGNPIPMRSEGQQFAPVGNIRQGAQSFGGVPTSPGFGAGIDTSPPNLAAVMDGGVLPPRNDVNAPPPDIAPWAVDERGYPLQPQAAPINNNPPMLRPNATQAAKDLTALPPGISNPQLDMAKKMQGLREGEAAMTRDEAEAAKSWADAQAKQQELDALKAKGQRSQENTRQSAGLIVQNMKQAIAEHEKVFSDAGMLGGVGRQAADRIRGTAVNKINADWLAPVKDLIAFGSLKQMREDSPTGGALGPVSDTEGKRLERAKGSLDATQDKQTFKINATRVLESYLDTVHGSREQRQKLLKEGKITPAQNAEVEAQYPSYSVDANGRLVPRKPAEMPGSMISPDVQAILDSLK